MPGGVDLPPEDLQRAVAEVLGDEVTIVSFASIEYEISDIRVGSTVKPGPWGFRAYEMTTAGDIDSAP